MEKIDGEKFKVSQNRRYLVPSAGDYLLVRDGLGLAQPRGTEGGGAPSVEGYVRYQSKRFYADCLHTAEELLHGQDLELQRAGKARSKLVGQNRVFGYKHDLNEEVAGAFGQDEAASPACGQAYAIVGVNRQNNRSVAPYHAAAVIAEDGPDKITLEVFATNKDAKDRNSPGQFAMYSTNDQDFHSAWKGYFEKSYESARTIVIEARQ